jgi:hypothetical protein
MSLDRIQPSPHPWRMAGRECQFCGAPIMVSDPIPRDAECAACGRDLRCCRQCRHYDPHYNNQCRETEADPQPEKDRRNFCEFFDFTRTPFARRTTAESRTTDARARLSELFGGASSAPAPPSDARKRLDDLFRKEPRKEGKDPGAKD